MMQNLLIPLVYLIINLVFGISLLMISHQMLVRYMRQRLKLDERSMVFNIVTGFVLLSLAVLMSEGSGPMISMIQHFTQHQDGGWVLRAGWYLMGFYILSCSFAYLTIVGSLRVLHHLTGQVDEQKELSQGNTGVALFLGLTILSMTMLIKGPLVALFEAIIPYPDLSY